jgi:hypothetical protein
MAQKGLYIALLSALFILQACRKNKDDEPVNPTITLLSVSADSLVQYSNALQVTFSYEDIQGDLGHPNPDVFQLSVKDARLENPDWYHVPPMTPDLKELHIKGNYVLTLRPLFLLGNASIETTQLTIQITDRAGNRSNAIQTGTITITQE